MADIEYLHEFTSEDIPPDRVLEAAKDVCTEVAVVVGWGEDKGTYFASSTGDMQAVLFALEKAKFMLMQSLMEEE